MYIPNQGKRVYFIFVFRATTYTYFKILWKKLTSIDFQVGQQQAFAQIIRIKPSFKRSMHSRLKMMADRVVSLHSTASSFSHVALLLPSNHGDCMQTWSVVVLIALSRGWWGNCYNPSHLYIQNDYLPMYCIDLKLYFFWTEPI